MREQMLGPRTIFEAALFRGRVPLWRGDSEPTRKVGSRHGVSSRGRHYKREVLPRKVMLGVVGRNTKGAPA